MPIAVARAGDATTPNGGPTPDFAKRSCTSSDWIVGLSAGGRQRWPDSSAFIARRSVGIIRRRTYVSSFTTSWRLLGQAFVLSSRPGWERYGRHRRSSILPRGALTSEMSSSLSSRRSNRVDTILEHGQLIRAELPPQWEELAALARDLRVLVAGQDRRGTGRV